jgi:leader peptidase (prepilin peptidase) / N-methyltransferase
MLLLIQYLFIFILGAAIGSFANVVIERLHRGESINGRSYCEKCKKTLKPRDLIPILSFLFAKGRCRYCHTKLSTQYLILEVATGSLFVLIYVLVSNNLFTQANQVNIAQHILAYGNTFPLIYYFVITTALIILFVTDLKYGMLYDKVTLPAILFAVLYKVAVAGFYTYNLYYYLANDKVGKYFIQSGLVDNFAKRSTSDLITTLLGSLGIALFFLILIIVTRGRGMGGGDLKLGVLVGLISGWPNMLASLFLGFLTGALASIILIIAKRKTAGQTIPFGPFLILACFVVMFFGNQLFDWYLKDIIALK